MSALWLQLEVHLEGIRAESWIEGDTLHWTPRSTRGHTRGGHTAMDTKFKLKSCNESASEKHMMTHLL